MVLQYARMKYVLNSFNTKYASIEHNPNEAAINGINDDYDVFIFFISSNYNERLLIDAIQSYRVTRNLPNAKYVSNIVF
jgi:hypothetical protein